MQILKRTSDVSDMIDGDIKLDEESAAELVRLYEENPQYLNLEYNGTDHSPIVSVIFYDVALYTYDLSLFKVPPVA